MNYGYYHLGQVRYQQNDLAAAERQFAAVVQQPYLNYGECYAPSTCGLALTHQVQGHPDEARSVLEAANTFMLETGNTTLLPLIQAFQAEIALRQGQLAAAGRWAAQLDPPPPMRPIYGFFWPHLTLVKIWLAQDTPPSRQKAAGLLEKAKEFVESTHNTRFLIEVLALQALLVDAQGEPKAALEQALSLAQPGGFVRLFVDLGPSMARLLAELKPQGNGTEQYVGQILAACKKDEGGGMKADEDNIHPSAFRPQPLVEPLTNREQDVLECFQLTDKEISRNWLFRPTQ